MHIENSWMSSQAAVFDVFLKLFLSFEKKREETSKNHRQKTEIVNAS